jgi:hypothetical protein
LLERRQQEEKIKSREEKTADAITRFAGSMLFVYLHLALFGFGSSGMRPVGAKAFRSFFCGAGHVCFG